MQPQILWGPTKRLPIFNFAKLEHLMKSMCIYYHQTLKYIFSLYSENMLPPNKTVFK